MKKFAELLNNLYFTYSHLDKMTLLNNFFANTADPERGYALAIMANTLEFPTFTRKILKELVQTNADPILFDLSYDFVGDISETIALLWPDSNLKKELPLLSDLIMTFQGIDNAQIKTYLIDLLNQSDVNERWAILKLGTGSLRIGISARFLKKSLAKYGSVNVQEIERIWHGIQPPYTELFDWLEKKTTTPLMKD
ncbi:MAG: hypothetical protein H0T84_01595 [Tatlockia sp.]|nr:hypothetical protein [Tatlockia sp.]